MQIPAVKYLLAQLGQLYRHAQVFPLISVEGQNPCPCSASNAHYWDTELLVPHFQDSGEGLQWNSDISVPCLKKFSSLFFKLASSCIKEGIQPPADLCAGHFSVHPSLWVTANWVCRDGFICSPYKLMLLQSHFTFTPNKMGELISDPLFLEKNAHCLWSLNAGGTVDQWVNKSKS